MELPEANGSRLTVKSPKSPRRRRKSKSSSPTTASAKVFNLVEEQYEAPRREFQNPKVHEADGNFFESFTALAWRQENKRLRAHSDDGEEKPPPSENQFAVKPKLPPISRKEFELLYIEVLYTLKHKIGTTTGGHLPYIQDLYQYAQESFRITPEDHARLLAKATEEKPPIVILNVTVLKARDLEAKDADGFSDPYCMGGIVPGRRLNENESDQGVFSDEDEHLERRKSGRKFSLTGKKKDRSARNLVPARLIRTTHVVPNTVNPEWNEKFRFDLEDVNTDRLHLDIWDHDDEVSVFDAAKTLNEVQSLRGLGRFFKQVAQSARTSKGSGSVDDFLGCIDHPLKDIPSTGVEEWYKLEGRSSKSSIQGDIKLMLSLATREDRGLDEDDNWTDVRQHEDLISVFIQHEISKSHEQPLKWNGELSKAAETILHQHAIQGDITAVQQAVCRWMAYARKHFEHSLSYNLLLQLLRNLDKLWSAESLSREEEEGLARCFTNFINYCLSLIRKQREVFPSSSKTALSRLESMLQCLGQIHVMKIYKHVCPFNNELPLMVKPIVKKGTIEWYERVLHLTQKKVKAQNSEDDMIHSLIEMTNTLNIDLAAADTCYNPLYERILNVTYFDVTFRQLEKVLAIDMHDILHQELDIEFHKTVQQTIRKPDSTIRTEIQESKGNIGTGLFELYLALQEFSSFRDKLVMGERKQKLHIVQYYQWFRFAVQKWLDIAKTKAKQRIHRAVQLDKVVDVKSGVKYSTSSVDVVCCFAQITEFWKQLKWPDLVDAFPLVQQIIKDICDGAVLYADLIHQKLIAEGYYDDEGQFDISEPLCITINNVEHVRKALKPLPDTLQFDRLQSELDKSNVRIQTNLYTMIKESDSNMSKKIKTVVDRVADKMRPDIKKDVFHLNWAPETVPAEDAVGDLMTYLDNNLLTLNSNLLKSNFDRILQSIWEELLEEFKEVIETEEPRQTLFYKRMFEALGLLVDFFNANGKGLTMAELHSKEFKDLKNRLSLYKMDTFALMEKFYEEKLEQQKNTTSKEYGEINVRVWCKHDTHSIFVEVIDAKNLIPLDANGFSDPYVVLQFCPDHVFPHVPTEQTRIVKKTLNPVFEETFEFSITPEQCKRRGAVLVLTVMDHDYVFQNDFAGEVYIQLCDIPGINGEDVSGYESISFMTKPLIHPKPKGISALDVLAKRLWDEDAVAFVKRRTKLESQSQSG
ncbi:BAI1-associated protein 3-like isoform X1 [Mytilus trossulus]|uniref:BAI1-associated protein 3-like isoform X1 n=1 Tax=Mytilus trossulus TaxID=6551 RepID=UPI003004E32E